MQKALRDVYGLVDAGVPFERIEAYVEGCSRLTEDERALLWCFAWLGDLRYSMVSPVEVAAVLGRERQSA